MGKKLIIRDADFSANAIVFPNSELQSDCAEVFKVGTAVNKITAENNSIQERSAADRASIYMVDLTHYYNIGCRNIKININNTVYKVIFIIGQSSTSWNTYDQNGDTDGWDWMETASLQGPITGNVYMSMNIARRAGGNISSDVVFSDIVTSIELS